MLQCPTPPSPRYNCVAESQLRAAVSNTTKSPLQLCSGEFVHFSGRTNECRARSCPMGLFDGVWMNSRRRVVSHLVSQVPSAHALFVFPRASLVSCVPVMECLLLLEVSESFKGCLAEFRLNGESVDLTNSKAIMGVRKCFTEVERGAHFDGYSYAVYGT